MRRSQRLGDLGAAAKAGIDQAGCPQFLQRGGIKADTLRLDDRRAVEIEAQPLQILDDAFEKFWSAAARVEILDPDAERARACPSMGVTDDRRKSMAQVQAAGRRRGETCDLQDSLHDKGDRGDS